MNRAESERRCVRRRNGTKGVVFDNGLRGESCRGIGIGGSGSTSDDSISRQRAPISFALEGSEDGTTWKAIDTRSGISWETDPTAKEMTFAVVAANLGSYRAYRFRTFKTTRNEASSKCGFQYVALKGVIGSAPCRYLDKAIGGYGFATRLDDFKMPLDSKIELDVAFTSLSGTQGLFSNCFSDDSKKFRTRQLKIAFGRVRHGY